MMKTHHHSLKPFSEVSTITQKRCIEAGYTLPLIQFHLSGIQDTDFENGGTTQFSL